MRIEVAYARADVQAVATVQLPTGATVEQAIIASGLVARFPEIDLTQAAVGIYGTRAKLSDSVADGDRVEIYRPLLIDPKEQRRRRARSRL
ncbi:MAG: RnfH family protein [Gammaproteobacteria bacterium]|nr:RnfH family protein [Gammaproteobacteria bacterium]